MMADLQSALTQLREPAAEPDGGDPEAPSALTEEAETPESAPKAGDGRVRDPETGQFAPKPKDAPAPKVAAREPAKEAKKAPLAPTAAAPLTEAKPDLAAAPAAPATKAPTNWRPEVREKWAALPPDVQGEIARREREISVGLGQAATARQKAEAFDKAQAPFEMMLRADGVDGPRKYAGYLGMEAALRTGPAATKGNIVAQIIKTFGVPIEAVASALDGTQTPQHVGPGAEAYRDPRVDQLFAALQHQATQRQTQQQTEAQATLERLRETNEFFEDLREDAADLLEASHKPGRKPLTIEEAFDRAAKLNPAVSQVLDGRKAAEAAKAKAAEAQKKRAAASSIRSIPGGPSPGDDDETDGSLAGDIQAVARKLASR